jgi:hypothetical protein
MPNVNQRTRQPWHFTSSELACFVAVGITFGLLAFAAVGDPLAGLYASQIQHLTWLKTTPPVVGAFSGIAGVAALRAYKDDVQHMSRSAHISMAVMLVTLSPFTYVPFVSCGTLLAVPAAIVILFAGRRRNEAKHLDWLAVSFVLVVGVYCLIIAYRSILRFTD